MSEKIKTVFCKKRILIGIARIREAFNDIGAGKKCF